MSELIKDIAAYKAMRDELETARLGKWVLFHDEKLIEVFDDFKSAAEAAVEQFGRGPYLIRQVGAPPVTLPASVLYHPMHGRDKMRI